MKNPGLGWVINSNYGNPGGQAFTTSATALTGKYGGGDGFLEVIQDSSTSNKLTIDKEEWGADLGTQKFKFDYNPDLIKKYGTSFVDCLSQKKPVPPLGLSNIPFQTSGFKVFSGRLTGGIGGTHISVTDSPRLPLEAGPNGAFLQSVLPAAGKKTRIDVMYNYVSYAVWVFRDKSIYPLGQAGWNVEFAGEITPNAGKYDYVPTPNKNGNKGSGPFGAAFLDNRDPDATGPIIANEAGNGWRR